MDPAVDKAIAEKTRIQAEISALGERLRKIDTFLALHREFSSTSALPLPPPPIVISPPPPPPLHGAKRPSIPDMVAEILRDGLPRQTAQLLSLLQIKGIQIGGNPRRRIINLSSTLSRDPRFENTRQEGWRLKETPSPAGTGDGVGDLI